MPSNRGSRRQGRHEGQATNENRAHCAAKASHNVLMTSGWRLWPALAMQKITSQQGAVTLLTALLPPPR